MLASLYQSPYTNSSRWLRGNLHLHTICGGPMDIAESGALYRRFNYSFLAVTDHNKAHTPEMIAAGQQQAGIILIPGVENGGSDHIIELGVHEATTTSARDFVARAKALQQAARFTIGCHPQEYANGPENIRRAAADLDALEIYNGLREARGTDEMANVRLWDEVLTAGQRLWAVASDDFHLRHITPGHGWVQVQIPDEAPATVDWQMIVAQLKRGAFYASTYPGFEQIALQGTTLRITAQRHAISIAVIGPYGRILHEQPGTELVWETPPGLAYFRIEARAGVKCAWSQPFFANSTI